MKRIPARLRPLIVVLAVPLLASAVGLLGRAQWDARWSAGLQREFLTHGHRPNQRALVRYSLGVLCSDPRTAARVPPCRTYNRFSSLILVSGGAAGAGLLLLGAVFAAGAAARASRQALLRGFRPALYGVAAWLILLLAAHAFLAVQALYLVSLVFGAASYDTLTLPAVAVVLLLLAAGSGAVRVARSVTTPDRVLAVRLPEQDSQSVLAALAVQGQTPPAGRDVAAVVVGLEPGVFTCERGTICLDGPLVAPALHFPLTLARILTVSEMRALAAWAVSPPTRGEGGTVARVRRSWRGARDEEQRLRATRGLRSVMTLPAAVMLTEVLDSYEAAMSGLGMVGLKGGDRAAAQEVGPAAYGSALLKLTMFGPAWPLVIRAMGRAVQEGSQYVNASELYAASVRANADPDRFAAVVHPQAASHDTSPRVRERLEGLGVVPETLAADALDVCPAAPAIDLLPVETAALEERLTALEHLRLLRLSRLAG